jgi:hypothetical protein
MLAGAASTAAGAEPSVVPPRIGFALGQTFSLSLPFDLRLGADLAGSGNKSRGIFCRLFEPSETPPMSRLMALCAARGPADNPDRRGYAFRHEEEPGRALETPWPKPLSLF